MTKGQIIESVLKEMRAVRSRKIRRPAEEDQEEQDVIEHLEHLLRNAEPDAEILTCIDFVHLNIECCATCHYFIFPFDMAPLIRLKSGEFAWVCCAIGSVIKRATGAEIPAKSITPEQPAKSPGYKPFAEFFGGKVGDDGK